MYEILKQRCRVLAPKSMLRELRGKGRRARRPVRRTTRHIRVRYRRGEIIDFEPLNIAELLESKAVRKRKDDKPEPEATDYKTPETKKPKKPTRKAK